MIDPNKINPPAIMAKNTGVPYELLVKSIFEDLLRQDNVKTKRLEQNIVLKGKTTNHQIDVYWEFEAGGTTYQTVVQAKDWNQTVSQGMVLTFKAVIDDLGIGAKGIMVTRTGYQDGAEKVAQGNGIVLYELREIEDGDWNGRIKAIVVRIHVLKQEISDVHYDTDEAWIKKQKQIFGIPEKEPIEIFGLAGELELSREDGSPLSSIAKVLNEYLPKNPKVGDSVDIKHDFPADVFIATRHSKIVRMPLRTIRCKYAVSEEVVENRIAGENFAHFILKNALDQKAHFFAKEKKLINK